MFKRSLAVAASLFALAASTPAHAQEQKPIKVGIVTFLSGAAAGPFGIPAAQRGRALCGRSERRQAARALCGKGYRRPCGRARGDRRGGRDHKAGQRVPQPGGAAKRRHGGRLHLSGDCLAIAPVAEELKKVTLFFDCGTPRIFEDTNYKYVFRPVGHAIMDNVAAAMYIAETKPNLKKYAGINQNYAWGQDFWNDFEHSFKALKPDAQLTTSQMPKLGAGQYNAEISALLSSGAEIIHSSFWGGDLEGLILQGAPRNLFKNATVILTAGETATHRQAEIPDGTVIGARGPNGVFAPDNDFNKWLRKLTSSANSRARRPTRPITWCRPFWRLKTAYEKAAEASQGPSDEAEIAATAGSPSKVLAGRWPWRWARAIRRSRPSCMAPQLKRQLGSRRSSICDLFGRVRKSAGGCEERRVDQIGILRATSACSAKPART